VRKLVEKDILRRQLEFLLNNPWGFLGGVVKIKSKLARLLNTRLRFSPRQNFLNTLDGHFFLIFSVFLSEALYLNQREKVVDLLWLAGQNAKSRRLLNGSSSNLRGGPRNLKLLFFWILAERVAENLLYRKGSGISVHLGIFSDKQLSNAVA